MTINYVNIIVITTIILKFLFIIFESVFFNFIINRKISLLFFIYCFFESILQILTIFKNWCIKII